MKKVAVLLVCLLAMCAISGNVFAIGEDYKAVEGVMDTTFSGTTEYMFAPTDDVTACVTGKMDPSDTEEIVFIGKYTSSSPEKLSALRYDEATQQMIDVTVDLGIAAFGFEIISLTFNDLNGDGFADLALTTGYNGVYVFINDQSGKFSFMLPLDQEWAMGLDISSIKDYLFVANFYFYDTVKSYLYLTTPMTDSPSYAPVSISSDTDGPMTTIAVGNWYMSWGGVNRIYTSPNLAWRIDTDANQIDMNAVSVKYYNSMPSIFWADAKNNIYKGKDTYRTELGCYNLHQSIVEDELVLFTANYNSKLYAPLPYDSPNHAYLASTQEEVIFTDNYTKDSTDCIFVSDQYIIWTNHPNPPSGQAIVIYRKEQIQFVTSDKANTIKNIPVFNPVPQVIIESPQTGSMTWTGGRIVISGKIVDALRAPFIAGVTDIPQISIANATKVSESITPSGMEGVFNFSAVVDVSFIPPLLQRMVVVSSTNDANNSGYDTITIRGALSQNGEKQIENIEEKIYNLSNNDNMSAETYLLVKEQFENELIASANANIQSAEIINNNAFLEGNTLYAPASVPDGYKFRVKYVQDGPLTLYTELDEIQIEIKDGYSEELLVLPQSFPSELLSKISYNAILASEDGVVQVKQPNTENALASLGAICAGLFVQTENGVWTPTLTFSPTGTYKFRVIDDRTVSGNSTASLTMIYQTGELQKTVLITLSTVQPGILETVFYLVKNSALISTNSPCVDTTNINRIYLCYGNNASSQPALHNSKIEKKVSRQAIGPKLLPVNVLAELFDFDIWDTFKFEKTDNNGVNIYAGKTKKVLCEKSKEILVKLNGLLVQDAALATVKFKINGVPLQNEIGTTIGVLRGGLIIKLKDLPINGRRDILAIEIKPPAGQSVSHTIGVVRVPDAELILTEVGTFAGDKKEKGQDYINTKYKWETNCPISLNYFSVYPFQYQLLNNNKQNNRGKKNIFENQKLLYANEDLNKYYNKAVSDNSIFEPCIDVWYFDNPDDKKWDLRLEMYGAFLFERFFDDRLKTDQKDELSCVIAWADCMKLLRDIKDEDTDLTEDEYVPFIQFYIDREIELTKGRIYDADDNKHNQALLDQLNMTRDTRGPLIILANQIRTLALTRLYIKLLSDEELSNNFASKEVMPKLKYWWKQSTEVLQAVYINQPTKNDAIAMHNALLKECDKVLAPFELFIKNSNPLSLKIDQTNIESLDLYKFNRVNNVPLPAPAPAQ